jgi:hypothetical protein
MDVVLGHPIGHVPEVAADVRQARAGPQQVGGQGMPGLMRDEMTDVQLFDPLPKSLAEPGVRTRPCPVGIAHRGWEEGHGGAFRWGGSPSVQ